MNEYRRIVDPSWMDDFLQGRSVLGRLFFAAVLFTVATIYCALFAGAVWFWIAVGRFVRSLF